MDSAGSGAVRRRAYDPASPVLSASRLRGGLGSGQLLPEHAASRFSASYGRDLAGVRVHPGSLIALAVGARALTIGTDTAFAPGEYQPGTPAGDELIGHELAHVVQQGGGTSGGVQGSGLVVDAYEREADAASRTALSDRSTTALSPVAAGLAPQRDRPDPGRPLGFDPINYTRRIPDALRVTPWDPDDPADPRTVISGLLGALGPPEGRAERRAALSAAIPLLDPRDARGLVRTLLRPADEQQTQISANFYAVAGGDANILLATLISTASMARGRPPGLWCDPPGGGLWEYIVADGVMLEDVAYWLSDDPASVQALLAANSLDAREQLHAGTRVKVPNDTIDRPAASLSFRLDYSLGLYLPRYIRPSGGPKGVTLARFGGQRIPLSRSEADWLEHRRATASAEADREEAITPAQRRQSQVDQFNRDLANAQAPMPLLGIFLPSITPFYTRNPVIRNDYLRFHRQTSLAGFYEGARLGRDTALISGAAAVGGMFLGYTAPATAGLLLPGLKAEVSLGAYALAEGKAAASLWILANPETALALAELGIGVAVDVADAGGIEPWLDQVSTWPGALGMVIDVLTLGLSSGAFDSPVPANTGGSGRRRGSSGARPSSRRSRPTDAQVRAAADAVLGPTSTPPAARPDASRSRPTATASGGAGRAPDYPTMSVRQLKRLATSDPEAAHALWAVYAQRVRTSRGRAQLRSLARNGDTLARQVLDDYVPPNRSISDWAGPKGEKRRLKHEADAQVVDSQGEPRGQRRSYSSGKDRPVDTQADAHTEAKAVKHHGPHLRRGETLKIRGTYDPCSTCRSRMLDLSKGGRTVEYWWPGGRFVARNGQIVRWYERIR